MENKRTIIAIIVVTILIVGLILISYFYAHFSTNQVNVLTTEVNKILEADWAKENIDLEIKTENNYAKLEKAVKEYVSKLKNIHIEMQEITSSINPNSIFSAQNVQDNNLEEIDTIISEFKKKSQDLIAEYEEMVTEDKIVENIEDVKFSARESYFKNLYNEIMLSDTMQNQYQTLEEEIKNEKANLYEKLIKINKIKEFLVENDDTWTIKNDKIQFTNLYKMTEYYNLLNQLID